MSDDNQKVLSDQQQKIVAGFQKLREQQQNTIDELSRVQTELRENTTVLKSIKNLNPDRRCFRQLGDTLFEHKASELVEIITEVLVQLKSRNTELETKTVEIGKEINAYKDKNHIKLLSERDILEMQKRPEIG